MAPTEGRVARPERRWDWAYSTTLPSLHVVYRCSSVQDGFLNAAATLIER